MAKINKTEKCLELRDKSRGELRADINTKGENDWTALHYAAYNGNAKLLSFLLYHEATIDA
jgi:ankyrin repeat protein